MSTAQEDPRHGQELLLSSWELVDVESNSTASSTVVSPPMTSPRHSPAKQSGPAESTKKLCGYLNKQIGKGIIKTWRTRWFVFDDSRCMLYYYRSPQDFVPVGAIEISTASFSFDLETASKGQFEIKVDGRSHFIQAETRKAMLYWLNELQVKRKAHSRRNLELSGSGFSGLARLNAHPTETLDDRLNQTAVREDEIAPGVTPQSKVDWSLNGLKTDFRSSLPWSGRFGGSSAGKDTSTPSKTSQPTKDSPPKGDAQDDAEVEKAQEENSSSALNKVDSTDVKSPPSKTGSPVVQPSSSARRGKFGALFSTKRFGAQNRRPEGEELPALSNQAQTSQTNHCNKCAVTDQQLSTLRDEVDILEREVSVRQKLIQDLHHELSSLKLRQRSAEQFIASPDEGSRLALLVQRDEEIVELKQEVAALKDREEGSDAALLKTRHSVAELSDQIELYKEMMRAKDEIVVSLTNQVFALTKAKALSTSGPTADDLLGGKASPVPSAAPGATTINSSAEVENLRRDTERLNDTVQAFEMQNEFLNSEIVELDELRQDDRKQIHAQASKLMELEAELLKLRSYNLVLLQEIQQPRREGEMEPATQDMISRLLKEAMETNVMTKVTAGSTIDLYDRYGFQRNRSLSSSTITRQVTTLNRRAQDLEDTGHLVRWENYMRQRTATRRFEFTSELKALVRVGIPADYRSDLWRDLVYVRVSGMMASKGSGYYHTLHNMSDQKNSLVYKQIELDLLRTLPANRFYNHPDAPGISRLRRVLRAYSWHNPVIGYCQGINRLAAIALLIMDEEDAFWCLVLIIDFLLPKEYFSTTLLASQVDQRVLKDLLGQKCPKLAAHLDNHQIDVGLVTFNWFLTVFVDNVQFETVLYIWDCFLYEGCKVLFRFALAIFKLHEDKLLALDNSGQIFCEMREIAASVTDNHALGQMAFPGLNPFPMRTINRHRQLHTAVVREEMAAMDSYRTEHQTAANYEPQKNDPLCIVFSDDEET